ncbi:MAG: hypothetical protein CMF31_06345 [Kordiimonas sp.]|nr:hypothetical protein [Kordiimonas sp.]
MYRRYITASLITSFLLFTGNFSAPGRAESPDDQTTPKTEQKCGIWDLPCWLDKIWPEEKDVDIMEKQLDNFMDESQKKLKDLKEGLEQQTEKWKREYEERRNTPPATEDEVTEI